MIKEIVDQWDAHKDAVRTELAKAHPSSYKALVEVVVQKIASEDVYDGFSGDPARIHQIDDGDYQGTLVFVIGAKGYQPSQYWGVTVGYGSCSGCDTLQAISQYSDDPPTEAQLDEYMQLCLNVVQGLKAIHTEF